MFDDPDPDEASRILASHDALPRILSRLDARARGYTDRMIAGAVRSGRWQRILPRTFFTGRALQEFDHWDAALAFTGAGAAISGAAALRIAGVRGISATPHILVLAPAGTRTRSVTFVDVRPTARALDLRRAPGPAHVEPARACADLALSQPRLDDVRALVARVVQGNHATVDEIGAELAAGPRQGSAHLRHALQEVGYGAASAPEARAGTLLRSAGIRGFVQNAVLDLAPGVRWIVDFLWPELRAALEIDSLEYHFRGRDWTRTQDRDMSLTTHGFSVIHRPPSALRDGPRFIADVRAWLSGREAELRRGLP